jgi:hypothetical protein
MMAKRANRLFWPASATVLMLLVAACNPAAIPASINAGQPSEATQSLPATQDTSQGGIIGEVEAMAPTAWTISGKVFEVTAQTIVKDNIQVGDLVKAEVEPGTSRLQAVSLASDSDDVNDNVNGNDDNENANETEDNENVNENENGSDDNENVNENDDDENENVTDNENENDDDETVTDNGNGKHNGGGHDGGDHKDDGDNEGGDD